MRILEDYNQEIFHQTFTAIHSMKTPSNFYHSKILFALILLIGMSSYQSEAQISKGGTPYSFGSNFKNLNTSPLKILEVEAPDMEKVRQEDAQTVNTNRFAVARPVNLTPQNSGQWTNLENGDRIWRLHIQSKDALSLRVLFSKFWLPEGAKVYIYTPDRQYIQGAFTNLNHQASLRFANIPLDSDELIVEYYEPRNVSKAGMIEIFRVDYGYRPFADFESGDKSGYGEDGFGASGVCNVNVNCSLGNDWQDEKRGVVKIILTNAGGADHCTASLINNTAQDRAPLMLSANHCISGSGAFVDTWGFIFNFEAVGCANPSSSPSTGQSIVGATLLSKYENSDFALMELNSTVPFSYNAYFNGWNRSSSIPASTVSIHHPSGDIKKISIDTNAPTLASYLGETGSGTTDFRVVWDQNTTTEGGSSGSPLFNPSGQIIGQLQGGGASCTSLTSPDYYGRLAVSWNGGSTVASSLASWLDPSNLGVSSMNGIENIQPNNDVLVTSILSTLSSCDFTSSTPIEIGVFNQGSNSQTNLTLSYTLRRTNNTVVSTGSVNIASIASGSAVSRTFNVDMSELNQTYTFEAVITLNSATDETPSNNIRSQVFSTVSGFTNYPYSEGFEEGQADWQSSGVNNQWAWGTPNQSVINRAASGTRAWVINLNGTYSNNQNAALVSPVFDFRSLSNPSISASVFINTEADYDGLQLQASTDLGQTWQTVGGLNTGLNWYNNNSSDLPFASAGFTNVAWSGKETSWKTATHSLAGYSGECQVQLRFLFISDNSEIGAGVAIDNINIGQLGGPTALENELAQSLKIFPNPTEDFVYLEIDNAININKSWHLSLWDTRGKKVWEQNAPLNELLKGEERIKISLQNLPKGLYILQVGVENQRVEKKIVLR
jgi:hypothetical protein